LVAIIVRLATTLIVSGICVVALAWAPKVTWQSKGMRVVTDARCTTPVRDDYFFKHSTSMLTDVFSFSYPRLLNGAGPRAGTPWPDSSPSISIVQIPRSYVRSVRSGPEWFEKYLNGWPEMLYVSGWPMRWAYVGFYPQVRDASTLYGGAHGGMVMPVLSRVVPTGVYVMPLAVNVAAFAVCIEGMRFVGLLARRRWRVRHARCAWCAYSLVGIDARVCPECGRQRVDVDAGEVSKPRRVCDPAPPLG
jgi:hypothetical protein